MRKRGFTVTELIAFIIIFGIVLAILIPILLNFSKNLKLNNFIKNANTFIEAANEDYLNNSEKWSWSLEELNDLLDEKIVFSPYRVKYDKNSYVIRTVSGNFKICLNSVKAKGGSINNVSLDNLDKSDVLFNNIVCIVPEIQPTN